MKITILSTTTQADGSFSVSGVFWLTAPSNRIVPISTFISQVPQVSDADHLLLRQGSRVETPFTSGLFAAETVLADVHTTLQGMYDEAQTTLDSANPTLSGLIGASFDGATWSGGVALDPHWIVAQNPPRTADGRPRMAAEKSTAIRENFFSHDWADPTTWYQQSVYVASETATDSGDHLIYTLAHSNVIDTYHGKITQEDFLKDAAGHSYRVQVKVAGVDKVEQDPHFGTGGDYTVDYALGKIVFLSAQNPVSAVTVTYHYENGSRFTISSPSGFKLLIEQAEVQFSTDIDLKDSMIFEAVGIADYFLTPAQMSAYGIPAGIGYQISLQKFVYKSFSDFQNDAFKAYPSYPAMGDPTNWRAQKQPVTVFDWDYVSSFSLYSSKGMEIRMYLEHDIPCTGWMATATMYGTVEAE